jgi:phytoene dehydrogenase-like protein
VSAFDALFVGSSPNALAGAARLAKSGARVCVVDTAHQVGGAVATDAFADGFRGDAGVASVALDPDIARELGLEIEVLRRDSATWLGDAKGEPVTLRAAPELPRAFDDAVMLLRGIYRSEPPDVPALTGDDAATLGVLGASLSALGPRGMHEALRLAFLPVRDFTREAGLDAAASALLAGVAVRGLTEGPFAPGTTFGLLHRAAIDDALFRSTARGGVQQVAEALAACARGAGAEIRLSAPGPLAVALDDGQARGVRLGDGTLLEASRVVSDLDARATFTRLVSPRLLDPEQNRAVRALRYRGSVARVHLGLRALPALRGVARGALSGTLVVAPSVEAIERAWDDGKRGRASSAPYVEVTLPSVLDPSLAPAGQHVLDAWVQHVPYGKGDRGDSADAGRDRPAVVRSVIEALSPWCPGLGDLVVASRALLPEDIEARFGVTEGQLDGGEVRLDQAFFLRPLPGFSHHRTPIAGLYLAGSAAHPGGYSGRSGWNLAGQFLCSAGPPSGRSGP